MTSTKSYKPATCRQKKKRVCLFDNMFWVDEITISAKNITLIDYQQQIVFPNWSKYSLLSLLIFLVMFFFILDCRQKKGVKKVCLKLNE